MHVPLFSHSKTQNLPDIKYGSLLEIDETLKKMRSSGPKADQAMLVEEVGPEEIAGVVSKWTGELSPYRLQKQEKQH